MSSRTAIRTDSLVAKDRGLLPATVQPHAMAGVTSHAAGAMAAKSFLLVLFFTGSSQSQGNPGQARVKWCVVWWATERELRARADG